MGRRVSYDTIMCLEASFHWRLESHEVRNLAGLFTITNSRPGSVLGIVCILTKYVLSSEVRGPRCKRNYERNAFLEPEGRKECRRDKRS